MEVEITRKIEFDAGHRIPDHKSKCRNLHGHRYVLEATLAGLVKAGSKDSDEGMVQDFGDLKAIMNAAVGDLWDHGFLVAQSDGLMIRLLHQLEVADDRDHKTVILPVIPTVENLASIAFFAIRDELMRRIPPPCGFELTRVRLYETPNCWADYVG